VTWPGQTLGTIKGADSVTGMLRGFIGALPDLRAAEQDIVAAGNTGGESPGARPYRSPGALGRRRHLPPCRGMIVEEWAADDATAILYQVGAYTSPWLAASRPTDAEGAG
jgi:hypothetical protein